MPLLRHSGPLSECCPFFGREISSFVKDLATQNPWVTISAIWVVLKININVSICASDNACTLGTYSKYPIMNFE